MALQDSIINNQHIRSHISTKNLVHHCGNITQPQNETSEFKTATLSPFLRGHTIDPEQLAFSPSLRSPNCPSARITVEARALCWHLFLAH
jgi:hypothetical protein